MTLKNDVYNYIEDNYKANSPIFLSELNIPDIKPIYVRQQIKKLVTDGKLKRFDSGIYYIPSNTNSVLPIEDVVSKKYLLDEKSKCCGYKTGINFANSLGLTTQMSNFYEIYTNKATTNYRETELGGFKIIIRKPLCKINEENVLVLQLLDLIKEIQICEIDGQELKNKILNYINKKDISFKMLEPFLKYYPDKIYKNMYEVGILNGISS